jgi:hypothetical protein
MTSNLGAEYLVNQKEGEDSDAVRDQVMAVVRSNFRPEFLNRVDEILLFHRLRREDMGRIVDIQLQRLLKLLDERKITIKLEPAAREWLADKGYDPAYGARPLKRVIQKNLQDPLAELILSGKVKDGDTVKVSAGKSGLTFNGARAQDEADDLFGRIPVLGVIERLESEHSNDLRIEVRVGLCRRPDHEKEMRWVERRQPTLRHPGPHDLGLVLDQFAKRTAQERPELARAGDDLVRKDA